MSSLDIERGKIMELHTREWYEQYAEQNGYVLGKNADRIIEMVNKNDLYCPCKVTLMRKNNPELLPTIVCPCQQHKQEICDTGHCHCTLFYKKEEQ